MRDKIYYQELVCYQSLTDEERTKNIGLRYYDLAQLPKEMMRVEFVAFLQEQARKKSFVTVDREKSLYNQLCRF